MIVHSLRNRTRGFTIVELVIVIAVIGILAAVSIVAYSGVTQNARDKTVLSDLDSVESEVARYAFHNSGAYGSAVVWYSAGSANANIKFSPSTGNVIDVVATTTTYCIRIYNTTAATYKTITTAAKKESASGVCTGLSPSSQAVTDSPL